MRLLGIALVLVSSLASSASAQQACPCVPLTKLWVATTCDTWNCAASALILANGDPMTFTVSSGSPDHPWIVVRQVVSGSFTGSADDPYQLDSFDGFDAAAARFNSLDGVMRPQIITAPDGKLLVLSLRNAPSAKKRAVGH
jgi:hypothetical protein